MFAALFVFVGCGEDNPVGPIVKSSDATLKSLTALAPGGEEEDDTALVLDKPFDADKFNYRVSAGDAGTVSITVQANDSSAVITVGGVKAEDPGAVSETDQEVTITVVPEVQGVDPIEITVTAENGLTQKTYSVIITGENAWLLEGLSISGGYEGITRLVPPFEPDRKFYLVHLANAVDFAIDAAVPEGLAVEGGGDQTVTESGYRDLIVKLYSPAYGPQFGEEYTIRVIRRDEQVFLAGDYTIGTGEDAVFDGESFRTDVRDYLEHRSLNTPDKPYRISLLGFTKASWVRSLQDDDFAGSYALLDLWDCPDLDGAGFRESPWSALKGLTEIIFAPEYRGPVGNVSACANLQSISYPLLPVGSPATKRVDKSGFVGKTTALPAVRFPRIRIAEMDPGITYTANSSIWQNNGAEMGGTLNPFGSIWVNPNRWGAIAESDPELNWGWKNGDIINADGKVVGNNLF
jgi:hypothetical protein